MSGRGAAAAARAAFEAAALRGAMALPEPVQRVLAGRPVLRDGQRLATETQLALRLQRLGRVPGVETLPITDGRRALLHQTRLVAGRPTIGAVRELAVAGLPARLYTPTEVPGPLPLLVFFHGGGFLYGDLETHDAPCRVLAERAGVRVLSIDYRLAPEHPFPAAYDDALAAYDWALEHAESLGCDPARLAVGGDSAGGNLAAGVALEAARRGLPLAFQLLVYPMTDAEHATRSYPMFDEGFYLTRRFMDLADECYRPRELDPRDPRLSPCHAELPAGLAPAYVATAGFDPLRDEAEAYARRLSEAGVEVTLQRFPDQIHGFLQVVGVGRRTPAAVAQIAAHLRAALSA
ncbi:alpha/beta hydrolase [Nocardioides sp. cx-169]|uniref:alpha/beta hydrolase n=1 Tax=Nocardioides sp. cx-169 TaxID=2899080 RepID=UPI001E2CDA51|nr:alpha/beta hydrolase [Nocardioides sp. cx-169]MCD4533717.1 alpha/beta hydrolase [Nocardioides sp. cx-169]